MHRGVYGVGKLREALLVPISLQVALFSRIPNSYVGRGQLSLRTKRLGGRCGDRICRMDRADDFDVTNSGFFVHSSLAPVLRFRRGFCVGL